MQQFEEHKYLMTNIYTKFCMGRCGKYKTINEQDRLQDGAIPQKVYVCDQCIHKKSIQPYLTQLYKDGHILYDYVQYN